MDVAYEITATYVNLRFFSGHEDDKNTINVTSASLLYDGSSSFSSIVICSSSGAVSMVWSVARIIFPFTHLGYTLYADALVYAFAKDIWS